MALEERDELVVKHRDYAHALAKEISRTLPRFVSWVDLDQVALRGLVEAANRFDPTRGVRFKTFAYYRIRGAVFDWIQAEMNASPWHQARRSAQQAVDQMTEALAAERAAMPTAVGLDAVVDAAAALASVIDLATVAFTASEAGAALVADASQTDPESLYAEREEGDYIKAAMETLPEKERVMIEKVYFEHTTIEEAGQSLGLSKSWASRLHARALTMLRDKLPELGF